MENVEYHFAPSELYVLLTISIACYAIVVSGYPSPKLSHSAEGLIDFFLYISWVPLALHYLAIISGLPPVIFIDLSDVLSNPKEFYEASKYVAYHIHIVTVLLFALWTLFLFPMKTEPDKQDKPSEDDEGTEHVEA